MHTINKTVPKRKGWERQSPFLLSKGQGFHPLKLLQRNMLCKLQVVCLLYRVIHLLPKRCFLQGIQKSLQEYISRTFLECIQQLRPGWIMCQTMSEESNQVMQINMYSVMSLLQTRLELKLFFKCWLSLVLPYNMHPESGSLITIGG
uniref:AT4G00020 protein n=1 Tax=Arabidopsis thaliana TaxID=3702 RepID=C0Z2A3_ARATH|nr:AT4G00020 [Arabidopsis thaliana]